MRTWLHRHGVARTLNTGSDHLGRLTTAYVEVAVPSLLLAKWTVEWRYTNVLRVERRGLLRHRYMLGAPR